MTRGHNIVVDKWTGVYNPHPHLHSPPTHTKTLTMAASKMRVFSSQRDQQTNGPTDQQKDKASSRVTCPQLKSGYLNDSRCYKPTDTQQASNVRANDAWKVMRGYNTLTHERKRTCTPLYAHMDEHVYTF